MTDDARAPDFTELTAKLTDIYDDYRTLLLSRKYNGNRVRSYAKYNQAFEIAIAVGTSSSGVAGFALWKSEIGQPIWAVISGVAILLAVIKPILGYAARIEEYTSLHREYATLFARCRQIVRDINGSRLRIAATGDLPEPVTEAMERIRTKMVDLAPQEDKEPDVPLRLRLEAEVNQEIPAERLWIP